MKLTIPSGWSRKRIENLGDCITGTTPKTKDPENYLNPEFDFIAPADLGEWKYVINSAKKLSAKGLKASRPIPKGTVLCVCIGSSLGKVGLSWKDKSCTNQQINAIICNKDFNPEFIYYLLFYYSDYWRSFATFSTVPILNKGRFGSIEIPVCDSLDEQKRIAYVLSTVQRAIAQQEQIIQTTTELKKALMHKLFTEGLHGEKQKETEIGSIPKSWDVARLDSITEDFQYGTSVKCDYNIDGVPVLRIPNVVGGHVDTSDLKFGNPKPSEIENLPLQHGDLLFVRTNGVKENAGRCSMYREELGDSCYYASYLIRVRLPQEVLNPEFLEEYSRTEVGALFLSGQAIRTADGKFNINSGTLKRMLIPKPDIKEQREIANVARLLDSKIRLHRDKRNSLNDLFQTLLHQLMTADIRVHDIDLSGFDDSSNITPEGSTQCQSQPI